MNDFEQELKNQLRRVPAPIGLADRVMSRVERKRRGQRIGAWVASALVMTGLLSGAGLWKQQQDRREQAQFVQQQVKVAIAITDGTIQQISEQVIQPNISAFKENQ